MQSINRQFGFPRHEPRFTSAAQENAHLIKLTEVNAAAMRLSLTDKEAAFLAADMVGYETGDGVPMVRAILAGDKDALFAVMKADLDKAINCRAELDAIASMEGEQ
jgi:hypothetical protein